MEKLSVTKRLRTADGTIVYYMTINGINKMHNWDGAAYIPQGNKRKAEYHIFGIQYTKEQWMNFRKESNGVPFYKTAAGKAAGARV